jgi:hypothetical protein
MSGGTKTFPSNGKIFVRGKAVQQNSPIFPPHPSILLPENYRIPLRVFGAGYYVYPRLFCHDFFSFPMKRQKKRSKRMPTGYNGFVIFFHTESRQETKQLIIVSGLDLSSY